MLLIYGLSHSDPKSHRGQGVATPSGTTERDVSLAVGLAIAHKLLRKDWRMRFMRGNLSDKIARANRMISACNELKETTLCLEIHMNAPVDSWPDSLKRYVRGTFVFAHSSSSIAMQIGSSLLFKIFNNIEQTGIRKKLITIPDPGFNIAWIRDIIGSSILIELGFPTTDDKFAGWIDQHANQTLVGNLIADELIEWRKNYERNKNLVW